MAVPGGPPSVVEGRVAAGGGGIALAALVLMLGNVLSRLLGLFREQLAAGLFGTGDAIAAFTIADNLQTLLFDLMASGALQAALIPVLAGWAAPDLATRTELRHISGALLTLVLLLVGSFALLGVVFAPWVVRGMIWFSRSPNARGTDAFDLTVDLVRIVLPAAALLSAAVVLQATLYALGRIAAPALSTALRNLAIVVAALLLAGTLGVRSMAWGTVVGAGLIVLVQLWPLRRAGALPRLNLRFRHPAILRMLALYLPVFLGLLVSSLAVVVDRGLAWGAGEQAVGAMRYATTLVQLVLGLVAAAISLAALPTLSRHFSAGDEAAYRTTLGRALALVTFLIFPAIFGLAALAWPVTDLLFGHGATGDDGVRAITIALLGYLPGTLAAAYDQVLIFAFYARLNTRTPVLIGVLAVGVYFAVALPLVAPFGMLGLVLANSAQFVAHAIVIYWLARRSFGWTGDPRLRRLIPRCAAASAVMAVAVLALWRILDAILPNEGILPETALVAIPATIGAIVYFALIARTCARELQLLRTAVTSRLGGSFRGIRR
ncbi:MAG: murein biosynthesis integral membrane protein MurJ [Chloroflexia bacterium]|nr:murein biosynthesis integral membrane protein MurJ [Chloroflexia bacterium]